VTCASAVVGGMTPINRSKEKMAGLFISVISAPHSVPTLSR
jgi:hypothetical protein